jgi:GT2 family glycosyltransferase
MSRLRIVIVNWNSAAQLRECLSSIVQTDKDGFELESVVVVDNASSDRSLEGIEALALPLKVIRNAVNRGFAAACNQGAEGAAADYLLFLNPDTRLFADSLVAPFRFMESPENERVGICGIQLLDEADAVSRTCARFPTPAMFYAAMIGIDRILPRLGHFMREWDHATTREVPQIIGAFFWVRRPLFAAAGGFDERFFVYLEDMDFSLRAWRAGWTSHYLASARAFHKGGGTSENVKAMRLYYSLRSRLQYGYKHFLPRQAALLAAATVVIEPLTRLVFALARGNLTFFGETLAGYRMLYRSLPELLVSAKP